MRLTIQTHYEFQIKELNVNNDKISNLLQNVCTTFDFARSIHSYTRITYLGGRFSPNPFFLKRVNNNIFIRFFYHVNYANDAHE